MPGAKVKLSMRDRYLNRGSRDDRANVGRHIVWPFQRMREQGITVWYPAREEPFQVTSHAGIGVLAKNQRCAGVVNENRTEAPFGPRGSYHPFNGVCELVRASAGCGKGEALLGEHESVLDGPRAGLLENNWLSQARL